MLLLYSGVVLLEPLLPKHLKNQLLMPAINPGDKRFVIAADGLKGFETVCLGRIERADWAVTCPSGEVAITKLGS